MTVRIPKFTVPDLANATPSFLIDELAKHRVSMNWLKKSEGVHKEALYGRIGKAVSDKRIEGERFALIGVQWKNQSRLDTEKIRANMSEKWLKEHTKDGGYFQIDLEPLKAAVGYDELKTWLHHLDAELFDE